MSDAKRDNNRVTTLIAVSSVDGVTPVVLYADPVTHRLLVSGTGTGGGGDVVGPESSTNNAIAIWDGITGKLLKNSSLIPTTLGENLINFTNPSAVRFVRINADNSVDALSDSNFRTAIGLVIGTNVQAHNNQLDDLSGLGTTKGDLAVFNGLNWVRVGVGTNGQSLQADSVEASGVKWATPTEGATELNELNDVTINTPTSGQLLIRDITNFKNRALIVDDIPNLTLAKITDSGALAALDTVGTAQILDSNVTYAKIQNVSATSRILGRIATGAGVVEELTGENVRAITGLNTTDSPQFAEINIGHATDTTLSRSGAGVIAVKGKDLAFKETGINTQTASYTLILADASKIVEMNAAGANTLTIPKNSVVAFPVGTKIFITQLGAGSTTIAPVDVDVTIRVSANLSLEINEQYGSRAIYKRATNEWILI